MRQVNLPLGVLPQVAVQALYNRLGVTTRAPLVTPRLVIQWELDRPKVLLKPASMEQVPMSQPLCLDTILLLLRGNLGIKECRALDMD